MRVHFVIVASSAIADGSNQAACFQIVVMGAVVAPKFSTVCKRLPCASKSNKRSAAALAVPTMALVPIITLLFGYFPIALNFPTVTAITAYYGALHAVAYYCKSGRQLRALWLANVGTSIMFWPYAKAALFTPFKQMLGRGLTFKATAKGVLMPDGVFNHVCRPWIAAFRVIVQFAHAMCVNCEIAHGG